MEKDSTIEGSGQFDELSPAAVFSGGVADFGTDNDTSDFLDDNGFTIFTVTADGAECVTEVQARDEYQ